MRTVGARDGQVLVRDENDDWVWRDPPRDRPVLEWTLVAVSVVLLLVAIIFSAGAAHADSRLPLGVTCDQVVRYASDLNIPNTFAGRAQARVIALTFGHWLTNAELRAAADCLRTVGATPR